MQKKRDKEKKLKVKMAEVEVRSKSNEIVRKTERYHNDSDIETGEEKRASANICILRQLRSSPVDVMNISKSFLWQQVISMENLSKTS